MTGTSPPGPLRCGSTTCRVKAVATAASKALPPFSSIAMPTAVAIQCVEVTTPKVPSISGLVVKGLGLLLLIYFTFLSGAKRPAAQLYSDPGQHHVFRCKAAKSKDHKGWTAWTCSQQ